MTNFKYQIVAEKIKSQIDNGEYQYGDKLPSENFLCNKYHLSRQSIRKAYELLEKQEYTYSVRGSGNFVKKQITSHKAKNVGVILSYTHSHVFSSITMGCEQILMERGYGMQLSITQNSFELEGKCLELMPPEKISGLIVEGTKSALPNPYIRHYQNLIHQGIPVVFIHNYYNGLQTPCVLMDDIQASKKLTQILLDAGHRKIAGIFKEDDLQGIRRFQGYAETLFEAGLQVDDRHIWWFHSNHEMWIQNKYSVEYSLDDLMECTALVCYNDILAEEIYHDLSQKGIRVPQDLSIVGFDNQNIKLDGDCYLTSVQHPRRKLGETAANLVCDMIEQGCDVTPAEPIIMPSTIVARNSIMNKRFRL